MPEIDPDIQTHPRKEFPEEAREVIRRKDDEIEKLRKQVEELQKALALEAMQHGSAIREKDETATERDHALELAGKDPLTELFNRRKGEEYGTKLLELTAQGIITLAYIRLDVDHFKLINDKSGHSWGDEVLKRVAGRLIGTKRETDVVSRYGGEEFDLAIPLDPNISLDAVGQIISRYLTAMYDIPRDDPKLGNREKLTASFGVAIVRGGQKISYDKVSDIADKALYVAKQNGRNQIQITSADVSDTDNPTYIKYPKV